MLYSPLVDLAVALGLAAGSILVGAQVWVLRAHLPRTWQWRHANAAARAVGGDAGDRGDWWCPADLASVGERLDLRPTADAQVFALLRGAAGTETGWVIDHPTGAVPQRVTRPADGAWGPHAVSAGTLPARAGPGGRSAR